MPELEMRAASPWSEARFRALTEGSGDIISLIDGDGRLVFNSAAAERISGFTREELAGADTFALMHQDDRELVRRAFGELLATPGGVATVQYRYRHKSGGWTWMEAVARNRLHDPDVRGVVAVSRDISERKRHEEELHRLVALNEKLVLELRESSERKSMFLAVLSHELRNPLAAIRNGVELLEMRPAEPVRERAVGIIDRQSRHLTRLMDDLLDVTRIAGEKVRLQREPLDLRGVVRRTVDDLPSLEGRAVEVALPSVPVPIDGDSVRVAQVIANLLGNAAKFTPRDGRIAVELEASGGDAVLTVSDDGAGLDTETLARLFEPFAQSDRTLDRSAGGLGLGLTLVKAIVELHGGTVRAESDGPGLGARFTVRLPLAPHLATDVSGAGVPHDAIAPRSVLIVDDSVDAADALRMTLELDGHSVAMAHSGTDGVAAVLRLRPDVVVCDIGLPGMDGYEVAHTLRADPAVASTYLVALSGYTQPEDRERARRAGFDAYLTKPVALGALEAVIARAPRRQKSAGPDGT